MQEHLFVFSIRNLQNNVRYCTMLHFVSCKATQYVNTCSVVEVQHWSMATARLVLQVSGSLARSEV